MLLPVILCGGSGTRLWPLSRKQYPKQFHRFYHDQSLLQQTAGRAMQVCDHGPLLVVTNEQQKFLVSDQLQDSGELDILIEPEARNTAPAIALAALYAQQKYEESADSIVLLVMPSDHLITDTGAFAKVVRLAEVLAGQDRMVTFGIKPSSAETGYGYIEKGARIIPELECFEVARFVEKPNKANARKLVDSGTSFWNSGIFVFKASLYLQELREMKPDVYRSCEASMAGSQRDGNFISVQPEAFTLCPSISIDYAVMEKTRRAAVVPYAGLWSDIGSWTGLASTLQGSNGEDPDGNITVGEVYTQDVAGSYIHATNRLVTAVGLKDVVVVETADAVLVTNKQSGQKVKDLVDHLRRENRSEVDHHTRVYRPWGSYQTLEKGDSFQVKKLVIKPGASISLQLHHKRSEHWVVVYRQAVVTKGSEKFTLETNESTYIPKQTLHKLENHARSDLEIIEVQTGEYLGEDDIERFEDQYGRA